MLKDVKWLKKNLLLFLSCLGISIGLIAGILCQFFVNPTAEAAQLVLFPGFIMYNIFSVLLVPFLISSIISGTSKLTLHFIVHVGWRLLALCFASSLLAMICAVMASVVIPLDVMTNAVHPFAVDPDGLDLFLDFVRNIIPRNLVRETFQEFATYHAPEKYRLPPDAPRWLEYTMKTVRIQPVNVNRSTQQYEGQMTELRNAITTLNALDGEVKYLRYFEYVSETNFLGLFVFATAFGIAANEIGSSVKKEVVGFFTSLYEILLKLSQIVMWYFPAGVIFMLVGETLYAGSVPPNIRRMIALYTLTVCLASIIHSAVVLSLCYFLVIKKRPWHFFGSIYHALMVGFGTGFSMFTLPTAMSCLKKLHVDEGLSQVFFSAASVLSASGGVIYATVTAIKIAQVLGISIGFGGYLTVGFICFITDIPSNVGTRYHFAGMFLALKAVRITQPNQVFSLLLGAIWIISRVCTVSTVAGNLSIVVLVNEWMKPEISKLNSSQLSYGKDSRTNEQDNYETNHPEESEENVLNEKTNDEEAISA